MLATSVDFDQTACWSESLLVAYVYFCMEGLVFNIIRYTYWVLNNFTSPYTIIIYQEGYLLVLDMIAHLRLTVHRRCFYCCLLSLYVLACTSWWVFILDSRLANCWERDYPFGFLLVVFWLWCHCFKCVLLSLWCLGRKVSDNYIDSWSLPSFLFKQNK